MGFDIYGLKPKKQTGEYFRRSIWWWHPLWLLVVSSCKDILTEDDSTNGHFNEGHQIDEPKALQIAARLDALTPKAIECLASELKKNLEPGSWTQVFDERDVREFAEFCRSSGGFEIW